MLFDTHAHLTDERFDGDTPAVLENMRTAGVTRCVCVGCDPESAPRAAEFARVHASHGIYAACGIHPHDASRATPEALSAIRALMGAPRVVAWGEIGLDYFYDLSERTEQREAFAAQLDMAYAISKPAILHIRDAHGDAIDILESQSRRGRLPLCVLHCFTGSAEMMRRYTSLGCYISFTGSVTFKNSTRLREVAAAVPAERLMVETDCPYLAPVPLRGHRNEPAYVEHVVRLLAQTRGVSYELLCEQTYSNALRFFGIEE